MIPNESSNESLLKILGYAGNEREEINNEGNDIGDFQIPGDEYKEVCIEKDVEKEVGKIL